MQLTARVRHVVLDMDGTIYLGGRLFAETLPFLAFLRLRGIGYSFLTNNSSHSRADYLRRLCAMGIAAEPEQIYTSTYATADYLRRHLPRVQRLFVLGTPSLQEELVGLGFPLADRTTAAEPDAVVAGFDTTLTYPRLCEAAWWIDRVALLKKITTNCKGHSIEKIYKEQLQKVLQE